jgi:hypothetical protein
MISQTNLSLATSHRDIDETASVCDSLLRATLGSLLLLLRLDLYVAVVSDGDNNERSLPQALNRSCGDIEPRDWRTLGV